MKKLSLLLLASCIYSITVAQDPKQDKYEEWCTHLHLSPEQSEKVAIFLDRAKEQLNHSKQTILETRSLSSTGATIVELPQQAKEFSHGDPILFRTLCQVYFLIGLDASYAIPNEALVTNLNASEQEMAEIIEFFEKIDEAIENCKQCSKLQKK